MSEENQEPDVSDTSDNSNMSETGNSNESSQTLWGELSEAEMKTVTDKGWKSPQDLLKSYQEMEKLSSNKFSIPKADDKEGWKKLSAKLGCPENIDGYDLQDVLDADKPFIDDFKKLSLDVGLRPQQLSQIYDWYKARQDKLTADFNAAVERDKADVMAEWGDNAAKNEELMKRGAKVLGLSQDELTNIEVATGTKSFMKMLKTLGEAVSEDTLRGLNAPSAPKSEEMSTEDWLNSQWNKKEN